MMDDNDADGVGDKVFRSLLDDVSSMCLVRECRELEEHLGSNVTESILHQLETSSYKSCQDQT